MAGQWVRVDSNLAANHKVLALLEQRGGDHALNIYVFGLGYCMNAGNDGFIPKLALGLFHGRAKDAQLLVEVGMWHELPGGWQVHDWAEYQPSSEEAVKRSEKAKRAAARRWGNVPEVTDSMLRAMPGAMPGAASSIAPAMPRTNGRTDETNGRDPSLPGASHGGRRAGANR